jgi:hypothetical protein
MQFLAHRGIWHAASERNTLAAFGRAFESGCGVELDVRDLAGRLVVAHDPPRADALAFDAFLELYSLVGGGQPVAINVKSCGLAEFLARGLAASQLSNYFVFDLAVPDYPAYVRSGLRYFTRVSEYEPVPPFYEQAGGIWMDVFTSDWISERSVLEHLARGKEVALVSPELHGRDAAPTWDRYSRMSCAASSALLLCTDRPGDARRAMHHGHREET